MAFDQKGPLARAGYQPGENSWIDGWLQTLAMVYQVVHCQARRKHKRLVIAKREFFKTRQ